MHGHEQHGGHPGAMPKGHPGGHPGSEPGNAPGMPARVLEDGSPVCRLVAWEVTRSCNLACKHCRAEAHPEPYPGELSTDEAKALIDTFPQVGNPIIIFTGGDPMMRPDVYELVAYTHSKGLTCAFSPNGTLITPESARRIKEAGSAAPFPSTGPTRPVTTPFAACPARLRTACAASAISRTWACPFRSTPR